MHAAHPSPQPAGPTLRAHNVPRTRRRVIAALTLGALVVAIPPVPVLAQAPTPVVIDEQVLGDQLFAALVQTHAESGDRLEHLLLSAELLEWRRQNPSASPLEATDHFAARRQALTSALRVQDRALPEPDFAVRVVEVLVATAPSQATHSDGIRALFDETLGKSVAAFDTREDLASGALRTAQWLRGRDAGEARIWSAVRRRAVVDEGFAQAWNSVLGTPLALDAAAPLAQLKSDPALAAYIDLDALLAHQDTRDEFLTEARAQFGQAMARLLQESQQARARLVQLDANCPVGLVSPTCTPAQKAAAEQTAKEEQKQIDGAATAAKIIGGLVSLTDRSSGERMQKAATAVFSIVTAINDYAVAVAGRSFVDALASGSTLALTGNILGAVVTLVGLFGGGGPSLDQQILQQVAALRNELRDLHKDMRASFQRIQSQLNTIFDAMMTEFSKLDRAVAGNTTALIDIQNTLARQNLRLEELAANILTAIGDVELHQARVDVNHYIGYAQTFGQPIPSFNEYTFPENEFHFVATQASTDAAFVLPRDSAGEVAAVLDNYGEASAISYLARRAHARDARVPDSVNLVANPSVWNFGAQAYTLLGLQNPGYAQQISPARGDEIALEGQRIVDTARSFSQPTDTPDASGNRTNPVFTSLLQEYRGALARLSTEMAAVRTKQVVVRDEPGGVLPLARSYDLFGPVDQPLPDSTLPADPAAVSRCTPPGFPTLLRPSNISFRSLAPELRLAQHAFAPTLAETDSVPALSQCYDVAWVNVTSFVNSFERGKRGRLKLTLRTRFRWAPSSPWRDARTATYTWADATQFSRVCVSPSCQDPFVLAPEEHLADVWTTDWSLFVQSASVAVDSALISEARSTMASFLHGRQRALYSLIASGIQNANSGLNRAVNDLNNATRQLQAYTRLGFPIALANDDILSSLLFGQHSIPANTPGNPQLDATYGLAFDNYACTNSTTLGEPCLGGPFQPLRNQGLLDTLGDGTTQPVTCGVAVSGQSGLPGDPLGDCLVASVIQRLDGLAARYRQHSQALAAGTYVEQLPWITSTLGTRALVDTLVRTPSN